MTNIDIICLSLSGRWLGVILTSFHLSNPCWLADTDNNAYILMHWFVPSLPLLSNVNTPSGWSINSTDIILRNLMSFYLSLWIKSALFQVMVWRSFCVTLFTENMTTNTKAHINSYTCVLCTSTISSYQLTDITVLILSRTFTSILWTWSPLLQWTAWH